VSRSIRSDSSAAYVRVLLLSRKRKPVYDRRSDPPRPMSRARTLRDNYLSQFAANRRRDPREFPPTGSTTGRESGPLYLIGYSHRFGSVPYKEKVGKGPPTALTHIRSGLSEHLLECALARARFFHSDHPRRSMIVTRACRRPLVALVEASGCIFTCKLYL